MPLTNTVKYKCDQCGSMYAISYTTKEHHDKEHCDGQLVFYCDACKAWVPDQSVCKKCENQAQAAEEKKRQEKLRRKELADRKKALEREIANSCGKAISAPAKKKCGECGGIFPPSYLDEEHHDNEHCDGLLTFYCLECKKRVRGVICDTCENREVDERREREEEQERQRRELEEQERQRRERAEKLRHEREELERHQRAFGRIAQIPSYLALLLTVLCMLLTSQLFMYGGFVIPYSVPIISCFLVLAIMCAVSVFVIAALFSL
jgi:cation transport ATPase